MKPRDRIRKIRRVARSVIGLEPMLRPDVRCKTAVYGSGHGAWRVCSSAIAPGSVVYSAGVGDDASFDLDIIKAHRAVVHAFDPTPRSIEWVRGAALPPTFKFHPYGVGVVDAIVPFHAPSNLEHVSYRAATSVDTSAQFEGEVHRISTIAKSLGHDSIDLLKLDIEGLEYDVIEDVLTNGPPVRQLLVEFHHRFTPGGAARTVQTVRLLRAAGFRLFAVSASGEECSFLLEESTA